MSRRTKILNRGIETKVGNPRSIQACVSFDLPTKTAVIISLLKDAPPIQIIGAIDLGFDSVSFLDKRSEFFLPHIDFKSELFFIEHGRRVVSVFAFYI